ANFDAAQELDPSVDFMLRWDPFVGGTAADFIQVSIQDSTSMTVFQTPGVGQAGALNASATSVVIPANTLPPLRSFRARLAFMKIIAVDSLSYPGAPGFTGFFKETEFSLGTLGAPDITPPTLRASAPANGATGVSLTAT